MASIRDFKEKKKVIETEIEGFYIKALSIKESKEIAKVHGELSKKVDKDDKANEKITMKLFGLACDKDGEAFDEFATFESIEELDIEEFNMFANAIKDALVPGASSAKK